jgi:hypothetical protein
VVVVVVVVVLVVDVVVVEEVGTVVIGSPRTGLQPGRARHIAVALLVRPSMATRRTVKSCIVLVCWCTIL